MTWKIVDGAPHLVEADGNEMVAAFTSAEFANRAVRAVNWTKIETHEECPLCGYSACPPMSRLRLAQEIMLRHGLVSPEHAPEVARNAHAMANALMGPGLSA